MNVTQDIDSTSVKGYLVVYCSSWLFSRTEINQSFFNIQRSCVLFFFSHPLLMILRSRLDCMHHLITPVVRHQLEAMSVISCGYRHQIDKRGFEWIRLTFWWLLLSSISKKVSWYLARRTWTSRKTCTLDATISGTCKQSTMERNSDAR